MVLPRDAVQVMKEADGPVSARYLAGRALALKGCPYPGPGVMKATRRRLSSMITGELTRDRTAKPIKWIGRRAYNGRFIAGVRNKRTHTDLAHLSN